MTQEEAKTVWMKRVMHLPVMHVRERDRRRWDKLTPLQRSAEHERYEIVCADIDRMKR